MRIQKISVLGKKDYESAIEKGYSYSEYSNLVKEQYDQKRNTGSNHSDEYLNYTYLSIRRMDRLDKKAVLLPATQKIIQSISRPLVWLVLTEGWCSDAAQVLPYLNKMTFLNANIQMRLILRDRNLNIMNAHLYNGTQSIPKLICMDQNSLDILGTWGPRPLAAQAIVEQAKLDKSNTTDPNTKADIDYEKNKALQMWYKKDKGIAIQTELLQSLGWI